MPVDPIHCFSLSYQEAADRFVARSVQVGCELHEHQIPQRGPYGEPLAIHVAEFGSDRPTRLVVSSGLHGVEGFYGSAVQLFLLESQLVQRLPRNVGILMLHALNPFGFAWKRRWNENNVDLNRNFLLDFEKYSGCHPLYRRLDRFLNPPALPRLPDYWPLAAWNILRYGFSALRTSVPIGQYAFPHGLFYGGSQPELTHQIVRQHMNSWLGAAKDVFHFDLHTGLGPFANCDLLIQAPHDSARADKLRQLFGADNVKADPAENGDPKEGTAYLSSGTWEGWCRDRFSSRQYEFVTVECGTYPAATVLGRLRAENAHYHASPESTTIDHRVKSRLCEAFAPASPKWRRTVVQRTVDIVERWLDSL